MHKLDDIRGSKESESSKNRGLTETLAQASQEKSKSSGPSPAEAWGLPTHTPSQTGSVMPSLPPLGSAHPPPSLEPHSLQVSVTALQAPQSRRELGHFCSCLLTVKYITHVTFVTANNKGGAVKRKGVRASIFKENKRLSLKFSC